MQTANGIAGVHCIVNLKSEGGHLSPPIRNTRTRHNTIHKIMHTCHDAIRSYWAQSGQQSTREFYPDPNGKNRCTVCCKTFKRPQDLKAHRTRTKHFDDQQDKKTRTAIIDAVTAKRKAQQKLLPAVKWGDNVAENQ